MVTMGNDWAVATKGPNGKMKLIPVTDTYIPQLSNETKYEEIDAQLIANGDNRRFRSKMRAEFIVNNSDQFNIGKMKRFIDALKQFNNDIIISSIKDPHYKIRSTMDVPNQKDQFLELFPTEEYKRYKSVCIHLLFTLESNTRIDTFKQDKKFMQFLENNKIYLSEHKWESTRIYSVGMFTKKLFNVTYRMDFEAKVQKIIDDKIKEENEQEALEQAISDNMNEDIDDAISTKTEQAKNAVYDSPQIDIITKVVAHQQRNKFNQNQGSPTKSTVLELRCDKQFADKIQNILKDANLQEKEFGKFSPYDITSNNQTLYYNLLAENNNFHHCAKVITLYGLHESVLHSIIKNPYNELETMTAKALFDDFYWEISENNSFPVSISIERSTRSADSGKWYFVTDEEGYYPLQQLLQKLIPMWNETEEYTNYINTNESFQRGIRFHYRATNDQSLAEYEKLLIQKTTNYENNSDASSIESYNSIKRYKRINAFQDSAQHNRSHNTDTQATSQSTWKGWGSPDNAMHQTSTQGTTSNDHTQVSVSSVGTLSTITASDLTKQFNEQFDAYQAKIDAQSISQETFNSSIRSAILKQQESFSNHQQTMDSIAKNVASLTESGDKKYNRLFSAIQELNDKFMMILGNSPQNQRYDELVQATQNPAHIQLPPSPSASDSSMLHGDNQDSPPVSRSLMSRFQGVQQHGRQQQQQQQQQQDNDTSMMFVGEGNVAFSPLG
jgi:hypothetical protein